MIQFSILFYYAFIIKSQQNYLFILTQKYKDCKYKKIIDLCNYLSISFVTGKI